MSGVLLDSCIDWGHWGLGPRTLIRALGARVGADLWASTGVDNIVLLSAGTTGADLWASTGMGNIVPLSAGMTVIRCGASSLGTSQVLARLDGTLFPVLLGR